MLPPRGSHAWIFFIGRMPQPFLLASPRGLGLDEASVTRGPLSSGSFVAGDSSALAPWCGATRPLSSRWRATIWAQPVTVRLLHRLYLFIDEAGRRCFFSISLSDVVNAPSDVRNQNVSSLFCVQLEGYPPKGLPKPRAATLDVNPVVGAASSGKSQPRLIRPWGAGSATHLEHKALRRGCCEQHPEPNFGVKRVSP